MNRARAITAIVPRLAEWSPGWEIRVIGLGERGVPVAGPFGGWRWRETSAIFQLIGVVPWHWWLTNLEGQVVPCLRSKANKQKWS